MKAWFRIDLWKRVMIGLAIGLLFVGLFVAWGGTYFFNRWKRGQDSDRNARLGGKTWKNTTTGSGGGVLTNRSGVNNDML